jgi:hypothetical protein
MPSTQIRETGEERKRPEFDSGLFSCTQSVDSLTIFQVFWM